MQERKDPWSVGAWMSEQPATVSPDTMARSAFYTMRKQGFRHLLVVEGGKLQGVVTDRDLRRPTISDEPDGWNDYYRLDEDYTVKDVMTADVLTARSKDPLERALKPMVEHKIGALPVLDKNDLPIGIITTHDMLQAFQHLLKEHGEALRGE